MKLVMKLLAALAAITGVVYVVATYGEQIVAFAKKLLASCPCCKEGKCEDCTCECECAEEEVAEEAPVEEVAEEVAEEAPVEEVVVEEAEPVAEDADFEA